VRALDRWIEGNIRIVPSADDPQIAFFPELAENVAEVAKLIQVAASYIPPAAMKKDMPGVLPTDAYRRVQGKGDACKFAERAVIVIGTDRSKIIEICRARTECKKHYKWEIDQAAREQKARKTTSSGSKPTVSPQAKAAEKKAAEARQQMKAKDDLRNLVLHTLGKRFEKIAPSKPSLALLALIVEALPWYDAKRACTWKAVALGCVASIRQDCFSDLEYKRLARLLKPFGLDVAAIEKELAPKAEVQTSAPASAKKIHDDLKRLGLHPKKKAAKK
jgi:hypothetical protein